MLCCLALNYNIYDCVVQNIVPFFIISKLRLDSLAQILTMANVRAHSRLLVAESCHGLVLGAVMDRMGGTFMEFLTFLHSFKYIYMNFYLLYLLNTI